MFFDNKKLSLFNEPTQKVKKSKNEEGKDIFVQDDFKTVIDWTGPTKYESRIEEQLIEPGLSFKECINKNINPFLEQNQQEAYFGSEQITGSYNQQIQKINSLYEQNQQAIKRVQEQNQQAANQAASEQNTNNSSTAIESNNTNSNNN